MAGDSYPSSNVMVNPPNQSRNEVLRAFASEWNLSESDMDMYFPLEQVSTQSVPTMLVASKQNKENVVGVCEVVGDGFPGVASFGTAAQFYLRDYKGKDPMDVDISRIKIQVLSVTKQPQHGRLIMTGNSPYGGRWVYYPNEAYLGKDKVEALVSVGNDIVRVVYNFVTQAEVVDQLPDGQYRKYCPRHTWKISSNLPTGTDDFTNWQTTANLNAMLANASGSLTNFSRMTASPRVAT